MTRPTSWQHGRVGGAVVVATVAAALGAAALLSVGTRTTQVLGIGVVGAVVGMAGVVLHPRIVYGAFAIALGALPFGLVPFLGQSLVLVLLLAFWVAVITHPIDQTRSSGLEIALGLFVVISVVALVMTAHTKPDYTEFAKWLLATSIAFALLRLSRRDMRFFGVMFSCGVAAAASFALAMFFLDKAGTSLNYLAIIGYGRTGVIGTHVRFYVIDNSSVVRLTGTYVDPNVAGIFLFVGLALAITLLRGWPRLIGAALILSALVITLSRSAIFSVVLAVLVFLVFQRISAGKRLLIVAGSIVGAAAALSVPAIQSRIFRSFSSADSGANDRAAALKNFPNSMTDHWLFGHGWGAPEFTDEVVGWQTNYVANTPLLTVYRGGIFVGIAFCLLLAVGLVTALKNMNREPWEAGVVGAAFVGLAFVGLQLDFPVVTQPSLTTTFSVLLAFLAANPMSEREWRKQPFLPLQLDTSPTTTHQPAPAGGVR